MYALSKVASAKVRVMRQFCSVRRTYAWKAGTYTYSIVKGDLELIKENRILGFTALFVPQERLHYLYGQPSFRRRGLHLLGS